MQQPRPDTRTYTDMVKSVGGRYIRAFTSSTQDYFRIKLWGYYSASPDQMASCNTAALQELFPEATVKYMYPHWGRPSIVLYFPR